MCVYAFFEEVVYNEDSVLAGMDQVASGADQVAVVVVTFIKRHPTLDSMVQQDSVYSSFSSTV